MIHMRFIAAILPLVAFGVYGQENGASAPAGPAPATSAESAPTAPPDVEQALRARVKQYFEACAQRKYREAEGMIDEPSRDTFYNGSKPLYNSFDEITKIEWAENFTHASVTVRAAMDIPMQTFALHAHPLVPSEWRLVDGQWYLHINTPEEGIRMPFFNTPIKIPASQVPAGAQPSMPAGGVANLSQTEMKRQADALLHGVKADRPFVELDSSKAGEQTVRLRNTTPGPVGLSVAVDELPGLSVKLNTDHLGPNEEAVATIDWKPKDHIAKPLRTLHVKVLPLGQDIPIQIRFSFTPVQNESASIPK